MSTPSLDLPATRAGRTSSRPAGPSYEVAWARFCDQHWGWMQAMVDRNIPPRLRARFDGDDVVQTAFLALCGREQSLSQADEDGRIRSFLGEVVRNELRDQVRHHSRQRRSAARECDEPEALLEERPCAGELPAEAIERSELRAKLNAGLDELEPQERNLVRRRFVDGWAWVEIARELELPEATVRRRSMQALDRLMRLVL